MPYEEDCTLTRSRRKAKCCNSEGYFRLPLQNTNGINTFGGDILMVHQTVIDGRTSFRE
jgi:hypothetical protein